MQRLHVGLLGGAIGLLSTFAIHLHNPTEFHAPIWFLPSVLFGLALIRLSDKASWWRRALALLFCTLGCPLMFFTGLLVTSPALIASLFGFGGTANVPFTMLFLACVGAAGGVSVALAWSVLYGHWSARLYGQCLCVGGLLAQIGIAPSFFPVLSELFLLLPIWCAGMLLLANSWSKYFNNAHAVQPQT